jgi:hypothetical protein
VTPKGPQLTPPKPGNGVYYIAKGSLDDIVKVEWSKDEPLENVRKALLAAGADPDVVAKFSDAPAPATKSDRNGTQASSELPTKEEGTESKWWRSAPAQPAVRGGRFFK